MTIKQLIARSIIGLALAAALIVTIAIMWHEPMTIFIYAVIGAFVWASYNV